MNSTVQRRKKNMRMQVVLIASSTIIFLFPTLFYPIFIHLSFWSKSWRFIAWPPVTILAIILVCLFCLISTTSRSHEQFIFATWCCVNCMEKIIAQPYRKKTSSTNTRNIQHMKHQKEFKCITWVVVIQWIEGIHNFSEKFITK